MKYFFKILFFVVALFASIGAEATSLPVGNIKATSFSIFHSPFSINFGGRSVRFTYAADGRKLNYEVSNTKEQFEDYRTYSGNLVFDINDNLDYILMPEGRIIHNAGTFTFEYHLKDHLGSTRVAFTTSPDPSQGGEISTVQETTYYPFGAPIDRYSWADSTANRNPYLREGKEYLSEHGWDKSDYGGRYFDPWKVLALQIDPLATRYYHISPYALWANNPIKYVDPDGRQILFPPVFGLSNPIMLGNSTPLVRSPLLGTSDPIKTGIETTVRTGSRATETTTKPVNQGRMQAGRQAEAEQLQRIGMNKNTESFTKIDPKTGKEGTTIPDAVKNGQTIEIKNVKRLTDSRQLRLQKEVSNENGQLPRIIINESAKISRTIQNGSYEIETYMQNIVAPQDNTTVIQPIIIKTNDIN